MVDFNACRRTEAGNIVTPKARLSYPYLLNTNPNAKTRAGKEKYTLSILIPPSADISMLKKAAGEAAIEEFGEEKIKTLMGLGQFNTPFLDAFAKSRTEKNPVGDEQFKGWTMIRATSMQKPGIVDASANNVDDASQIYPGRWACVSLRPFTYPAQAGGHAGVSFGLQNVQLLDHDTPLAGSVVRAEDEFEPVETGETASSGDSEGASADSVFG